MKGTDCPTECTGAPKDAHFRIHLKTGNLTITKMVSQWNEESGNQATFLFEVKKIGTSEKVYYMSVTVDKAKKYGDATLNGLPAGEYTIQEIPTYGYEVEGDKTQNKTIGNGTTTKVGFTNTAAPEDYTKDGSMAINRFNKDDSGNWTWTWANKPTGLFR